MKFLNLNGKNNVNPTVFEDNRTIPNEFERIGIQAKFWNRNKTITKPEIQKFFGALADYPTIGFSPQAKKYADEQRIVFVDGKKLAELMIEYGIGVQYIKFVKLSILTTIFSVNRKIY